MIRLFCYYCGQKYHFLLLLDKKNKLRLFIFFFRYEKKISVFLINIYSIIITIDSLD